MTSASKKPLQGMRDVEKGGVDGGIPRAMTNPDWDRMEQGANAVALNLTHTRPSIIQPTRKTSKVRRLTGFPDQHGAPSSPPPQDPGARFRALPYVLRGHVISMIGELIGTFSFLFFALAATQLAVNSNRLLVTELSPESSQSIAMLLYIAVAFGFSLAINAWTFFRVSGGLFNPAVNFALCLVGALTWLRGGLLFVAQIVGAVVAAAVVSALFPGDLSVDTTLGAGTNAAQGFFIEAFATFELVLVIFMLAAEKHEGRFLAPIGIGIALFVAEMASVAYTGGSLNPARSFAPAVVNHSFPQYHWIYWLGPLLGAAAASLVYKILKILEYETANPDSIDPEIDIPPQLSRISTGLHLANRRPATPPTLALGRDSTFTGEDKFQDALEWQPKGNRRSLSGFGEGLVLSDAQGSNRKQRRILPD